MTAYENFERTLTDYLKLLELSRIKIQDEGSRDEDSVTPTARSIRHAYIVTEFLDRFFEKPRSLIRIVGRVCEWNNLESHINEIKDIQAARREAFRPFARLCETTESHPVVVHDIKPCMGWLDVVARFNSLITQEELEIKWIIAKAAKSANVCEFLKRTTTANEQKPATNTRRTTTVDDRRVYATYKNRYVVDPEYKSCKKDKSKKRGLKQFYDYYKDEHFICDQIFQKTLGEKYSTFKDFERAMDAVRKNNKYNGRTDNNKELLSRGEPKVERKWRSAIPSA